MLNPDPISNPAPLTLVLAATGKTGRRVAARLEQRGVPVRRGSRSADLPFDWHDATTWAPVLVGVEAAYIVYTPDLAVPAAPASIRAFTALASLCGVRRLVLLSGRGEVEAQRCECIVQESGLQWTIVRSSWFSQNFSEGDFHDLVVEGELALPAADMAEPFIDVEDIADVVVAALTEDGHSGQVYEVTGPRLLTFADAAAEMAKASGRDVRYQPISHESFATGLAEASVPTELANLLEYLFSTVLDGRNAHVADGVERALGRAPRDFSDFARDVAATGAWSGAAQGA